MLSRDDLLSSDIMPTRWASSHSKLTSFIGEIERVGDVDLEALDYNAEEECDVFLYADGRTSIDSSPQSHATSLV